jgi:hypothetical protein
MSPHTCDPDKRGGVWDESCHRCRALREGMAEHIETWRKRGDEQIGQRIIDAIVSGGLIRSECPDAPASSVLSVWAENAAEQIGRLAIDAAAEVNLPAVGG